MKAALLGLSHPHTGSLLATLENMPEIHSIVLWDASESVAAATKLASRKKVTLVTSSLDRVLSDRDLDFAMVCVRHDEAAALSHRVIAAGKHLLAEKPVGMNANEIDFLRKAAARNGVVGSVLYSRRAHPCMVAAHEIVRSGALGPLFSMEVRFLTTQVKFRNPAHWLFRREHSGGGILLWLGCHCLDLLHHISGDEITEVGAFFATRSGESIDIEDTAALALRFRSGAVATFNAGYTLAFSGAGYVNAAGNDSYLAFNGRAGRVVWPDLEPRLHIETPPIGGKPAIRQQSFEVPPSTSYGGVFGEGFIRQFLDATQGRGAPPTTLSDALRTARVIEAAEQSTRTGRMISVEPLDAPTGRALYVPPLSNSAADIAAWLSATRTNAAG